MNILFFDNFVDFIGPQAQKMGMTREEYVAYYLTESDKFDNSLGLMTFEAYQTYNDYNKSGKAFGSPEDLKADVLISVKHLIPVKFDKAEGFIKSIEDQSQDKKGIKFEIKLTTGDIIHAYKIGSFRGSWEWYLNKKKLTKDQIVAILLDKMYTPYEIWQMNFDGFDKYHMFSDDNRAYSAGKSQEKEIERMYNGLSNNEKTKAYKYYVSKSQSPIDFVNFKGI
jgi:hypothetical protein